MIILIKKILNYFRGYLIEIKGKENLLKKEYMFYRNWRNLMLCLILWNIEFKIRI